MVRLKDKLLSIVIFLIVGAFVLLNSISTMITDFWWFKELGFEQIFLVGLKAKIALFFGSALIFLVFALINLAISSKLNKSPLPFSAKFLVALAVSFFVGLYSFSHWFTVLQYFKQVSFGIADPIFMKDVAFYVFTLPFILAVWKFAMAVVVLTTILVLLDYLQTFLIDIFVKRPQVINPEGQAVQPDFKGVLNTLKDKALVHLAVLGSVFFLLLGFFHYISRFSIMYSEEGIVVGAGYTDVVAFLPIIMVLMVLAVVVAFLMFLWIFVLSKQKALKKRHILAGGMILYAIVLFFGLTLVPAVIQALVVSPNEINLERPYIENNIKFTNIAYGLSDVETKDFAVEMGLTPEVLAEAPETIDNVRILDWRPLTTTYKQTQEIRLYYDLAEVDIDRYMIDGKYTQVMLSPREMNQNQIADNAKTWVNLHMVYTHGYGIVVSPVNSVTKEGLPNYLVKDIPPAYEVDEPRLKIEQPQIYYGEIDNDYVLVNTKADEFDYPKGDTNQYINYDGEGGVELDSFMKKLVMALRFGDIKILLSSDITPDSSIMFMRNIKNRIRKITPFLEFDGDPYIVIDEGKLYWIMDAYTVTGNFPYSEKVGSINYIRNSVKVVVDAYNGDVSYYVIDKKDPLILTYARIFPNQFKSISLMPEGLKEHLRYPEDLFKIQSRIYSDYHMDDATVFYNKEDAWEIPNEIYGTGQRVAVEPYYVIMKLPGESKEEFVMMTTFTPIRKDNMIAWLAAKSDGENYGELLLYRFPKEKLIFGPLQIEAKIDQDSDISQQLTLWSQQGSRVTRGNLLVIPIEDSILYVEPLYIQAETGQLPELKRVLISDGERVVMEKNLATALEVLFGKKTAVDDEGVIKTQENLIIEAQELYDSIIENAGEDWTAFGDNLDKLGEVLSNLK